MHISNIQLEMRVLAYTIEKHEGLVRFYHDERKVPVKYTKKYKMTGENIQKGRVFQAKNGEICAKEYTRGRTLTFPMEWYEQNHWAYDENTGDVFYITMENNQMTSKKRCGHVPVGTSRESVLAQILDKDITTRDEYSTQDVHRKANVVHHSDYQTKWSVEMDGKNIMALCIAKPKMTLNEIKNVIINEGGSVDAKGIIHKPE